MKRGHGRQLLENPWGAPLAAGSARLQVQVAAALRAPHVLDPGPGPATPTCDPAHEAPQPPARFRGRVRAQAVADEVHVVGAVPQLGLRREGASGPARGAVDCAQDPGWTRGRSRPPPALRPADRLVRGATVLTSGRRANCRCPRGPEVHLRRPPPPPHPDPGAGGDISAGNARQPECCPRAALEGTWRLPPRQRHRVAVFSQEGPS